MQPRFTARLVVPTPPMAPATAITWLPRGRCLASPETPIVDPSQRGQQVFDPDGLGEEFLGPARSACRIRLPSFDELTTNTAQLGDAAARSRHQVERFLGIGVDGHQADIRVGLGHDVGKELVARTLGFEPNQVHPQQHALERFALHVVGVDYR